MLRPIGGNPNRFKALENIKDKLPKDVKDKLEKADLKDMRETGQTRAACYVPIEPPEPGDPEPGDYPPPN